MAIPIYTGRQNNSGSMFTFQWTGIAKDSDEPISTCCLGVRKIILSLNNVAKELPTFPGSSAG